MYQLDYNRQVNIEQNKLQPLLMPFSEVCSFMGISDKVMLAELLDGNSVQLYDLEGNEFSCPILFSEAGIYQDRATGQYYSYQPFYYAS